MKNHYVPRKISLRPFIEHKLQILHFHYEVPANQQTLQWTSKFGERWLYSTYNQCRAGLAVGFSIGASKVAVLDGNKQWLSGLVPCCRHRRGWSVCGGGEGGVLRRWNESEREETERDYDLSRKRKKETRIIITYTANAFSLVFFFFQNTRNDKLSFSVFSLILKIFQKVKQTYFHNYFPFSIFT